MRYIYSIIGILAISLFSSWTAQAQTAVSYGANIAVDANFTTYYACLGEDTDNGEILFRPSSTPSGSYVWKRNGVNLSTGNTNIGSLNIFYNTSNNYRLRLRSSSNSVEQEYEGIYELIDTATNTTAAFFYLDVVPSPIISLPTSGNYCVGDALSVAVTASNGPPLTYTWEAGGSPTGSNSGTITTTDAGIHSITVSDHLGCSATGTGPNVGSPTAPQPTLQASVGGSPLGGTLVCPGSDVVLTASTSLSNPTFRWQVNGSTSISTAATFSINNVTSAQNISVEVRNGSNCWSTPRTLNLGLSSATNPTVSVKDGEGLDQVNSLGPPVDLSNLGTLLNISNTSDCGANARLSGPGVSGTTFYPGSAVTTSNAITLNYECPNSDCGVSDDFTVNVYTLAFNKSSYCVGDDIVMNVQGLNFTPSAISLGSTSISGFSNMLTTSGGLRSGTISFTIPTSISGTQTLVLQGGGEEIEETVTINTRPATPTLQVLRNATDTLSSGTVICPGDNLGLSTPASTSRYYWTVNGQSNSTPAGNFAVVDAQSNLSIGLHLENANGCTSDTVTFDVTVSTDTTAPTLAPDLAVFDTITVNSPPISLDTNVSVTAGSCHSSTSFSGIGVSNNFFYADVAANSGSIISITYSCLNNAGCPLSASFDASIGGAAIKPKANSYCLGTTVTLDVVDLTILVDSVTVPLRGGGTVKLPLDTTNLALVSSKYSGELSFPLPNQAISGTYIFHEILPGTRVESTAISVRNPELSLNLAPEYCSNSSPVALSGSPTTGNSVYSLVPDSIAIPSNVLNTNILNPANVDTFPEGSPATRFRTLNIVRAYTPTGCTSVGAPFYPIRDTFQTVVRDIQLNGFDIGFGTYANSSGPLNLTSFVSPDWGTDLTGTFSGSGVVDTSFFAGVVDTGQTYTLTFTRQNGGCSVQDTDTLRVVEGSDLGLRSIYCTQAEGDTLRRDPNTYFDAFTYPFYRYSTGTRAPEVTVNTIPSFIGMTQITQYQPFFAPFCNVSEGLMTEEWIYGAFRVEGLGIVTLDTTLGQEEFVFRPDLVNFSGSDTTITIEFSYFNWDRLPFDQILSDPSGTGCQVYYPAGTEVYRFRVSYQPFNVRIFRPTFQANTPAALCGGRSDTIQLQASPNNGVFRLQDMATGGIIDTLLYGSASGVVPSDFQVTGQDTTYHLVYDFSDVSGFNACPVDTIMSSLRIVGDYNLNFTGRHSNHSDPAKRNVYCLNESNDLLTISLGRSTSGGGIITGPGVIQSGGSFFFSPSQANVGTHTLTLSYTDTEGCLSTEQKQFKVVAPPSVVFTGDEELCVNDGLNTLTAAVNGSPYTPNGTQDTAFFVLRSDTLLYGATYLPANLAVGIANVQVIYVDSAQVATGCRTVLNDTIQIFPTPNLSISGLAPAYCASDPNVTLTGSPSSGGTGSFFGSRIVSANVFDPDAVAVSTGVVIDEVNYTFEDGTTNCRDTISQNVEIRQVPSLNLSGLNTEYCSSDDVDTSITPIVSDAAGSQVSISFTGLGARLIGNDLQFRPATLVDSSQTSATLNLEYTSSSGCVVAINRNVSLFSTPTVSMANTLDTTYCSNAQPITFQVTGQSRTGNTSVAEASLSGGGIPTASQNPTFTQVDPAFNITYDVTYQPTLVSPGQDTVTFLFTDEEGCENSISRVILIDTLPSISLTGLNAYYCAGSGTDTLQGLPAGGSFGAFGTSVAAGLSSGGLFDPNGIAVGMDSLFYSSVGANGCRDTLSQSFEVRPLPVVSLTGLNSSYCSNEDSIALAATPAGGWFSSSSSINAVDSMTGIFRPVTAGATSSYPVTYTFVDAFGCVNSDTDNTEVLPTPNPVSGLSTINFCTNAATQALTGNPGTSNLNSAVFYLASGGPGVNLNAGAYSFNPSLANAGVDTIVYQVQNNSGCTEFDRKPIFVVTAPDVTFTGLAPFYCKDASNAVLTPNITGGIFSSTPAGAIVNGNEFSAAAASPNNYDVVYAYQENTTSLVNSTTVTCADTHIESVELRPLPTPSFTGLAADYCQSDTSSILLTPAAGFSGGVFSNTNGGISGNFFRPNDAQAGQDTITYSYTDATTTCTGLTSQTTQIRRQPNSVNIANLNNRYCADAITTFDVQGDLINIPGNTTSPATGSSVSVTGYGVVGTPTFDSGSGVFQNYDVSYDLSLAAAQNIPQDTVEVIFANEFGCSDTIQQLVLVDTLPDVRFQNLATIYCRNGGVLTLTNTGIPSIFTGSGGSFLSLNNAASIQNNVEYVLATTALGVDTLIYDYEDDNGCQDTAQWIFDIVDPPVVSFDFVDTMGNVVDTVCLSSGLIRLVPNLLGGDFSGSGVIDDTSFTTNIGSGTYTITYTYTDASTGCSNSFQDSIVVAPRPEVRFTGLSASAYCQNSLLITLADSSSISAGYGPADFNQTFFEQTLPTGAVQTTLGDTLLLNPINMIIGQHTLRRVVEDSISGCRASVSETVVIHPLPDNLEVLNVDSTQCRNDVITAEGRPVQGANSAGQLILFWNAPTGAVPVDTTFGNITTLEPASDTLPNGQVLPTGSYTYEYLFRDGNGCENVVLDTFAIHPNPVAQFVADPVCEGDTISLLSISSITDAISAADSIQFIDWRYMSNITAVDSLVRIPTESQDVGSHDVQLEVTTGIGCVGTVSAPDGLKIYAQPPVSFAGSNHCEGDSSLFVSDSTWIDYLDDLQAGTYSTVFELGWDFGDGNSNVQQTPVNNYELRHVYAAPGAYQVTLSLEVGDSNFTCSSRDSLSFIVSPSIDQYPYYQTFDTEGDWFAESSDASLPDYWNWGLAQGTVIQTTAADSFNTVWKTQSTDQAPTDAWLYGACFDLDSLERPMIAFDYWSQTEEGLDGTVLEYFDISSNEWLPLGEIERGINWFNTNIIAGAPGDQTLAPRGWSGRNTDWKNARYRLDNYQNLSRLRLRLAFGASGSVSTPSDGFAFDNIWVGERQKNVLLETFSNKNFLNMSSINNRLYNLLYSPDLVRDVTLLQYHGKEPNPSDEFHQDNPGDVSSRELFYKVDDAAEGFKDGTSVGNLLTNISNTSDAQFEAYFDANMLQDPDFKLGLNRAEVTGGTVFVNLSIEALRDLAQDDYVIHIAVLEDSLTYPGGNARVHAVMRKLLPEAGGELRSRSWAAGDLDSLSAQWAIPSNDFNSNNFVVVAFIQSNSTEEVFQSISNRNISGFLVVSDQVTEEEREVAQEGLFTAKLFPNPAKEGFHVAFDSPLEETCHWEIFDLQGRLLQSGEVAAPTAQFYIAREGWSPGMYVLRLRVGKAYTQRRVIFARP